MKRLIVLLISLAALSTACAAGNVFSLTAGDCFNDPDDLSEVSSVEMVECSEAHDNEVYATYDVPGSVFPGATAIQAEAFDGCLSRFDPYVGATYQESTLDISFLTPTSESWAQDDREIVCFLYDLNGAKLTTSVRGTGI